MLLSINATKPVGSDKCIGYYEGRRGDKYIRYYRGKRSGMCSDYVLIYNLCKQIDIVEMYNRKYRSYIFANDNIRYSNKQSILRN